MKNNPLQFILLLILTTLLTDAIGQTRHMDNARSSVVKIKTTYVTQQNGLTEKELGNATGWCWKEPTLVVTALHAVTGANMITVYNNDAKKSIATVEKVLLEADMALLRLKSDLGLIPLQLKDADPNSGNEYYVWGYPQGVFSMQGDDIRFSLSQEKVPTLNSILTGANSKLKRELEAQTYPMPNVHIFRISSTIQPGHSGAPIMAKEGNVIGMADGGLREGTARINWAMPAFYYVPLLDKSMDRIPGEPSIQASLYSSRTKVDANTTEEEENSEDQKDAQQNTLQNGKQSISKTWTASYDDIFETLSKHDQEELLKIINNFNVDISDTQYDVYEDFETGATIAVPFGEHLEIKDGWYMTSNDDESLTYDALPFSYGSFDEARTDAIRVFRESFPENEWIKVPDSQDDIKVDAGNKTASYFFTRVSVENSDRTLFCMAEIDGADLLVADLIYDESKTGNIDYMKQYMHYLMAIQMCAFAEN